MSLPCTLSRDLVSFIGREPQNHEMIASKFENRPELVLKFIKQASMNRSWFDSNYRLIFRLVVLAFKSINQDSITWDSISKTTVSVIRYNQQFHARLVEVSKTDPAVISYLSLIFISRCEGLRDSWIKVPIACVKKIQRISESNPFKRLYSSVVTDNFFGYFNYSLNDLLSALNVCVSWKCSSAIVELENIICLRINSIDKALIVLTFACLNQNNFLKERALSIIHSMNFFLYKEKPIYVSFCAAIKNNTYDDVAGLEERRVSTESYFECNKNMGAHENVLMQIFEIYKFDDAVAIYLREAKGPLSKEVLLARSNPVKAPKDISRLFVEDTSNASKEVILGFMVAFDLNEIEFHNSSIFNSEFIKELSLLRPNLEALHIIDCPDYTDVTFEGIAELFPKLSALSLTNVSITDCLMAYLLKIKELDILDLSCCELALPKEIKPLSKLFSLSLSDTKIVEGSVNELLENTPKLIELNIVDFEGDCDPSSFSFASNLEKLSMNADALHIREEKINELRNCVHLKELFISGKISVELKPCILNLMHRGLKITFLGKD